MVDAFDELIEDARGSDQMFCLATKNEVCDQILKNVETCSDMSRQHGIKQATVRS